MMEKKRRVRNNFKFHVHNARRQKAKNHVYGMSNKSKTASNAIMELHKQYKNTTSMGWGYMFLQTTLADNASLENKVKELQYMVGELKEKVDRKEYLDIEEETIEKFKGEKNAVAAFVDYILEKDQMMTIHQDPSLLVLREAARRADEDPSNRNIWGVKD
mmetsp:Transcript_5456/g.10921  ORF Transcript_5456/g.10921 Transcript_5456/m.10921 type:complete len:160 (+) Transcript_5456:82-561(+)